MGFRTESDSIGSIEVPTDKYYGAQTQRSLENFKIGGHQFPREFIRAYGIIKKAAATVNNAIGKLDIDIQEKYLEWLGLLSLSFLPYHLHKLNLLSMEHFQ